MTLTNSEIHRLSAPWLSAAPLQKVLSALTKGGREARVVGGAVRNTLAGHPITDIDIATTATPDDVLDLAGAAGLAVHPTGIAHGTVTVVADGVAFEVTTLRRDVETDGRRAVVAFTTDWSEDAHRRDFTINAIYCGADGVLYDPTGGREDLKRRSVRFIGDASARIREDYLRILRFFRFSAGYGVGPLDPEGLEASAALKDGIAHLSAERIWAELKKLLTTPRASEVVRIMADKSILTAVLGGPASPDDLARLQAIESVLEIEPDPITRLAALATADAASAAKLATKLRLSRAEEHALRGANARDSGLDPSSGEAAAHAALYRLGAETYGRAQRLTWARSRTPPTDHAWRERASLPERWTVPSMPFSGADAVALGIPAGPRVGRLLDAFEKWWIEAGFPNDVELLQTRFAALAKEV